MADLIEVTPITVEQLTESKVDGSGVFDTLMRSVNVHLLREFNSGRISNSDYAEVYLGGMQSVINQSIQFLLSKDKATLEASLVEAQVKQVDANTELVNAQKDLALLQQDKVNAEVAVLQQQLLNLQQEKLNLEAVKLKTEAEIDLLNQKKVTEQAQTVDGASGVIGKQMSLYEAQREGFTNDAKAKFVKAANDVYAIAKSNDPDAISYPENIISKLENLLSALDAK